MATTLKKKHIFLTLGAIALLSSVTAPFIYLQFRAQELVSQHKYKQAANNYKQLSLLSHAYLENFTLCHYKDFVQSYTNPKQSNILLKLIKNELSTSPAVTITDKNTNGYYIQKAFIDMNSYIKKYCNIKNTPSLTNSEKEIENLNMLIQNITINNRTYLEETVSLIQLASYQIQTTHAIDTNSKQNAQRTYDESLKLYKNIMSSDPSPYAQNKAQYLLMNIFNKLKVHPHLTPFQLEMEKKILKQLEKTHQENLKLSQEYGDIFSLRTYSPAASLSDIDTLYTTYIKKYLDPNRKKFSSFIVYELSNLFADMPNKLKQQYFKQHHALSILNDFYYVFTFSSKGSHITLPQLYTQAKELDTPYQQQVLEHIALHEIETYQRKGIADLKKQKTSKNYQKFQEAFNIYTRYSSHATPAFSKFYASISRRTLNKMRGKTFLYLSKEQEQEVKNYITKTINEVQTSK